MKRIFAFVLSGFLAASLCGCKKDNRPTDMPPLFPAVVTIVQEGVPLSGAAVSFVPLDGAAAKYQAIGGTNDEGKVTMKTYGFEGAPAGKYKVTVRKLVIEGGEMVTNSDGEEVRQGGREYQGVEQKFMNAESTPHEIEVTASGVAPDTFDVGKAIKP